MPARSPISFIGALSKRRAIYVSFWTGPSGLAERIAGTSIWRFYLALVPWLVGALSIHDQGLQTLLRGVGVEVGPGGNPFVRPAEGVDVRYLEESPADQWADNYGKHTNPPKELWDRYVVGDAHHLASSAPQSLDFIFCNHVFEHLMNPAGVIRNWASRLRPGGAMACVVPDRRFCFDLRQPPVLRQDWMEELSQGMWLPSSAKYERWCTYTAPWNTTANLIQRHYSIHMHYWDPMTMDELLHFCRDQGFIKNFFVTSSCNNKDFLFVARS